MKLLVCDVEGTIFEAGLQLPGTSLSSTIWQAIATALGPEAVRDEVESHARWDRGEYRGYMDWMVDTIRIHIKYGISEPVFRRIVDSAVYSPNVVQAFKAIDRSRYVPVLISGGFHELAVRAQRDLGIHHALAACQYLFGKDGKIRGFNLLPCDFEGKIDFVRLMLREYNLARDDWVFIGDGANDVPIARAAPFSIGYRPHQRLRGNVTRVIDDFTQLPAALLEEMGGQAVPPQGL